MSSGPPRASLSAVKTVQCSCGHIASGATADELLAAVETHIDAAHARPTRLRDFGTAAPLHYERIIETVESAAEREEKQ